MGEYRVILADPPWQFRNKSSRSSAETYYPTLSVAKLKELPIRDWAAPSSVLFLWTTMVHIPHALQVMQSWGYVYRTVAFTWVKLNKNGTPFFGLGNYTRGNAELCLLGTSVKSPPPKVLSHAVPQVILSTRREHSRKPDEQYERIMRLFDGPYLELFARNRADGWDIALSNEPDKFAIAA